VVNDQQLGDALRNALHQHMDALAPRADLADVVIRRRRAGQLKARLGGTGAAVAVTAAVAAVVLSSQSSDLTPLGQGHLRLAGYSFQLPQGAHAVSATPAACAIGAGVTYSSAPSEGVSDTSQPAIAQAVTSGGGCVSMLLTDPYTPGAANAPSQPFPVVDQHQVQIGSDAATIGTYQVIGADMTFNGVPVPSGTEHVSLNVEIPTNNGQVQDLDIAAAGVSEQQLLAIATSGLAADATSPATGR
jgi:hypothetical protein